MTKTSDSCIICLKETKNISCKNCNCFCHDKCWNLYLNKNRKNTLLKNGNKTMVLFERVKCPICKIGVPTKIYYTRSTLFRYKYFTICSTLKPLYQEIRKLEEENKIDEMLEKYEFFLKQIGRNKNLILKDKRFYNLLIDELNKLKHKYNWKKVFYYEYHIFGSFC